MRKSKYANIGTKASDAPANKLLLGSELEKMLTGKSEGQDFLDKHGNDFKELRSNFHATVTDFPCIVAFTTPLAVDTDVSLYSSELEREVLEN